MTNPEDVNEQGSRVGQDVAQRILSRLVEIEERTGSQLSIADLRSAAIEAGFSPAAFDSAASEIMNESATPREEHTPKRTSLWTRLRSRLQSLWKPSAIALTLGACVGVLISRIVLLQIAVDDESTFMNVVTAVAWTELVAASLIFAFRNRKSRDISGFLIQNAALWLGMYLGLETLPPTMLGNEPSIAFAAMAAVSLVLTTPIGCAIVAIRRRRRITSADGALVIAAEVPGTPLQPLQPKNEVSSREIAQPRIAFA